MTTEAEPAPAPGLRFPALTPKRVAVTAAILVGLQLIVRGVVAARGYFYWDDLILIARSGDAPVLSADFLLHDHDGHLMPAAFLLAGIATKLAPLNWIAPAITLITLQAIASFAVWRLLHVILGARPALLAALGLYLFSPLTLPSFAWWANGLNQLPLQAGIALTTAEAILLYRTGRARHAVVGTAALVFAVAFFEKSVVIPFVAFAAVALLARTGGMARPLRTTARACARMWIPAAAVLAAWTAVYLTNVRPPLHADLNSAGELLNHGTSLGLLPALFGGPWSWERWPPSPPWASPPTALVALCWLAVAVVVAWTYLRRRRVGWVWPSVAAYALASQLAMILSRAGADTAPELPQTLRYVADTALIVAVALAIIARAPRRATRPGFGTAFPQRPRPVVLGLATVVLFGGSMWSTYTFDRSWRENPTVDYVRNAKAALSEHQDVPLLSQPISIWVLLPVAAPYNRSREIFAPLRDRPEFSESTPILRMFDDDGRLVPAEVTWVRALVPGAAPDCGTRVTGEAAGFSRGVDGNIALSEPVLDWEWTTQLNYLSNRDGLVDVSMPGEPPVTVPVTRGPGTVYVRLQGGGDHVHISAVTPDLNLCVGGGPFGNVAPKGGDTAGGHADGQGDDATATAPGAGPGAGS